MKLYTRALRPGSPERGTYPPSIASLMCVDCIDCFTCTSLRTCMDTRTHLTFYCILTILYLLDYREIVTDGRYKEDAT